MVNQPWLFSVLWCSGVSSVTTNACQVLKEMKRPIWLLVSKTSVLVQIFLVQLVSLVLQLHAGWALLCAVLVWQRDLADLAGAAGRTVLPVVLNAWLVTLQPSSTYLMIWIVVDCVSFLMILWAFLLMK